MQKVFTNVFTKVFVEVFAKVFTKVFSQGVAPGFHAGFRALSAGPRPLFGSTSVVLHALIHRYPHLALGPAQGNHPIIRLRPGATLGNKARSHRTYQAHTLGFDGLKALTCSAASRRPGSKVPHKAWNSGGS